MITNKSIQELDKKMLLIAKSNGLTIEQFRKLPRKRFIEMCNKFNGKQL